MEAHNCKLSPLNLVTVSPCASPVCLTQIILWVPSTDDWAETSSAQTRMAALQGGRGLGPVARLTPLPA